MSVLTTLHTRFKIGTRIAAGFISILALLAIVAGADYVGLTGAQTSTKTAGRIAQTFARVATIDTGFAQLRINTLVFATSGSADAEKQGRDLQRTMLETANTALAAFNDEKRKESMRRLITTLNLYSAAFDEIVTKKALQQRAAIDVARPMGARVQADLSELLRSATAKGDWVTAAQIGVTQELFLSARLNINIFLQANDPKIAAAGQEIIGKVPAALARLREVTADPELRSRAQALGPVIDQFIVAFNTTITTISDVYRLSDTMDKLGVTAREQINVITAAQLEALNRTRDESLASITQTITNSLSVTAAAFAAGLLLAWLIGRGITRPIRNMTGAMATLAGGALELEVPSRDSRDEIGDMAEAVQVFKENALRVRQMEAEQKEAATLAATGRKAEMHRVADAFQAAVGGIVDTVSSASTKLEAAANTLTHSAENTQRLSGIVASASDESSANVQSAANAADEMNTSVLEISRQVQNSSKIAQEAVAQAQKTDARINELSQAAQRIGDVVKLISAVAEQTNLLALNATIEAARAGEAGRGFAVVASEVKALAAQTAKATEEISAQITSMQTATADSVGAIKEIGSTIGRISEIAGMIAAAVEEQGAATQEIARNVGEAAKGTTLVATNISDVNRGAAETGTASAQVLSSAQSLSSESNHLKIEVEKFLATVRAA